MDERLAKFKACKRYDVPGDAHALTFSCSCNKPLMLERQNFQHLATSIENAKLKYHFAIWAYVFMPEHAHLLICPLEETYSVSKILQCIKQSMSRKTSSKKPFWQAGGGYDHNISSRDGAVSMMNYIHLNPVRRGLAERPELWQYSSYRDWKGICEGPLKIDKETLW